MDYLTFFSNAILGDNGMVNHFRCLYIFRYINFIVWSVENCIVFTFSNTVNFSLVGSNFQSIN